MAYIDVITLSDAKVHLRIDDTLSEDDASITRMINSALGYVERWTNVYVYSRLKTHLFINGAVKVYDFPVNSLVGPVDAVIERKTLYTTYCSKTAEELVLNVGYIVPADVPDELREVALELIDLMYYEAETGKNKNKDLSSLSIDVLNRFKRFII